MIERWIGLCLLFAGTAVHAAPLPPDAIPGGLEPDFQTRLFHDRGDWVFYGDLGLAFQTDHRRFQRGMLGAYWVPEDHLKIGAFYRKTYGIRHDEDWISQNGSWSWRDTRNRGEDHFLFDVTPRFRLLERNGLSLIGEFKSRFILNTTLHHRTLFLRPGINAFFSEGGLPVLSAFVQFETQWALGRGGRTIPEKWLYLGIIRPIHHWLEVGVQAALKWESWGATPAYLQKGGAPYLIDTTTWNLGLLLIYRLASVI